jgi:GNAT superfamily N-acetyltransferase
MKLVDLDGGRDLDGLYHEVLLPSFPPDQMVTLDDLRRGVRGRATEVSAVVDEHGRMLGGAVGDWSPPSRVMLLSYLAVAADRRDGGIGSLLYSGLIARWRARYHPCLILAEVESPDHHAGSQAYGDPAARLRFYQRRGARVLDLPYFQPALGAGRSRVFGVLLLALHVDPELTGVVGSDTVASEPLRIFLTDYLVAAEGGVAENAATAALWRALEMPGGVPLRSVEQFREVAVSRP